MRILLADDHALFRGSLRSLVETRGLEVVGEASDGRQAIELASQLRPDLLIMDLSMPVLNGIDATRLLNVTMPHLKVVLLTASMNDEDLFEALRAGAHGFLLKDLEADSFFDLLDRAMAGELALTPQMSQKVLEAFSRREAARFHDLGFASPSRPRPPQAPERLTPSPSEPPGAGSLPRPTTGRAGSENGPDLAAIAPGESLEP